MARRAAALSPKAVLETAAGSGVVTRALAPKLSPDARYVVTDLNQPMLDYAATRQEPDDRITGARPMRRRCRSKMPPSISFAASSAPCSSPTARRLPRGPARAQAGRIFPVQCLGPHRGERVCRRRDQRARGVFPNDPPRFMARTPHGYHDTALIRSDLEKAGFSERRRSKPGRSRAARPRPVSPRSPIARARRCATRSKPAAPDKLEAATEHAASAIARKHGTRRGRRQNPGACHSGACMIPVCARGWVLAADSRRI